MSATIAWLVLALCIVAPLTEAHSRLSCPRPRDWNNPVTKEHLVNDNTV